MCPGCRAILDPGVPLCPYCGWDVALTDVRRKGGLVERTLRPVGGLVPALLFANVLVAALVVVVHVKFIGRYAPGHRSAIDLVIDGVLGPNGLVMLLMGSAGSDLVIEKGQAWRLLTCVFLHFGILHIGVNMMSLRNIGGLLEDAYGSGKALALYLLSGLAASAASVGWHVLRDRTGGHPDPFNMAGASGAICGYAGLIAALGFRIGGDEGRRLWTSMVKSVGIIVVIGFVLEFTKSSFRLANSAHLGGFLFGLAAGFLCTFGIRCRGNPLAVKVWDAVAILLALLTAASFAPAARDVMDALR